MPSRKTHTKRRAGCTSCKRRKVRCDLQTPVCQNCLRRGIDCSWPDDVWVGLPTHSSTNNVVPIESGLDGTVKVKVPVAVSSMPDVASALSVEALMLLHHYTTKTCFKMAHTSQYFHMWQSSIPEHAFSHDFLLHGILAIAAVHKHHEGDRGSESSWLEVGRTYEQTAISLYIPHLQDINARNCHALFAHAVILGSLSFAFLQHAEVHLKGKEFIKKFLGSVELFGGCVTVAIQAQEELDRGDLHALFRPERFERQVEGNQREGPAQAFRTLLAMLDSLDREQPGGSSLDSLMKARRAGLHGLSATFPRRGQDRPTVNQVGKWPVRLSHEFTKLVRAGDPLALCIVALYGTALQEYDFWSMEGLGQRLVLAVQESIDKNWATRLNTLLSMFTRDRPQTTV